jgi:phage gp36-like protein
MAYATIAQLKNYLGQQASATNPGVADQLTDRVSFATLNEAELTSALSSAEAQIDGKVGTRYQVPVDTTLSANLANHLKWMTLQLAGWILWQAFPREEIPARVTAGYDNVKDQLDDIQAGEAVLASAVELASPISRGDMGESGGSTRIFTPSNMERM